ncbi:uncharacterized protein BO97DRAFT_223733 [Aspergillus homomorphus CBS 101889]|uniref:Uncharacterized protein n=1 Tax=Aspergillus homomorphus (strain CBS 101889) TaxID=1450537 RepID=A0A395HKX7_ASPHC|nr:hypothetical protein BO97DRAFT_223733 [Aspergillus homomorphus CBS 101889]RAL08256.1 hypothetical protein BO97DRAFT_223733 [Aspergillus homomorphus CBS 101889]
MPVDCRQLISSQPLKRRYVNRAIPLAPILGMCWFSTLPYWVVEVTCLFMSHCINAVTYSMIC